MAKIKPLASSPYDKGTTTTSSSPMTASEIRATWEGIYSMDFSPPSENPEFYKAIEEKDFIKAACIKDGDIYISQGSVVYSIDTETGYKHISIVGINTVNCRPMTIHLATFPPDGSVTINTEKLKIIC